MNEEVLAMKPGRDLDIRVALEVMGYIWITHLIHFSEEMTVKWLGTHTDLEKAQGAFVQVKPERVYALKLRDRYDEAVPHYSTEISDAQKVIERMRNKGVAIKEISNPEEICKEALIRSAQ